MVGCGFFSPAPATPVSSELSAAFAVLGAGASASAVLAGLSGAADDCDCGAGGGGAGSAAGAISLTDTSAFFGLKAGISDIAGFGRVGCTSCAYGTLLEN